MQIIDPSQGRMNERGGIKELRSTEKKSTKFFKKEKKNNHNNKEQFE